MGAKYYPTSKDLKANQRFQQKQTLPKSPFKKAPVGLPADQPAATTKAKKK